MESWLAMSGKFFKNVEFITSAAKIENCPVDNLPEVVLAGRSNAGKSSLVNSLSGNKKMAKVSQTPGKTQLLVYFKVENKFYITDLPGYGFTMSGKQKTSAFYNLADNYFNSGRNIDLVILILDIRHEPSSKDLLMYEYLQATDRKFIIVLNKCDKLSRFACNKNKEMILKKLHLSTSFPAFCVSNLTNTGIDELVNYLSNLFI